MINFRHFFFLIVIAGFLISMTSCATLLRGSKTRIGLNCGDSTILVIDGMEQPSNVTKVMLPSKTSHTISIAKPGYKPIKQEIYSYQKILNFGNLMGGFATGAAVTVMGTQSKGDNRSTIIITGVTLVPLLAWGIFSGIDAATGSNKMLYPDTISWIPVKLPLMNNTKEQLPVGCTHMNIRLKIGDKIGEIKGPGKKQKEAIIWENTVNVKVEELEVIVNNDLKDYGFKVPEKLGENGYSLDAEVTTMDIRAEFVGNMIPIEFYDCRLKVRWTLTNLSTGEAVQTSEFESSNLEKVQSLPNAIYSAFENSLLLYLSGHKEIYNLTSRKEEPVVHNDFDIITLQKPVATGASAFNEYIKSVVTVETDDGTHGSGFFISGDGYIITNNHVVKGKNKVNVILNEGLSFIADVVRTDAGADLALLKVSGKGFKYLRLAESDSINTIGTEVYAVGTPVSNTYSQSLTKGIISGNRLINNLVYIQSDVSVSPGNSGGPLLTREGIILGIVTSKLVEKGVEGISFILPSGMIMEKLRLRYGN